MKNRSHLSILFLLGAVALFLAIALHRVIDQMKADGVAHAPCKSADFMMLVVCIVCIFILFYRLFRAKAIYVLLLIEGICFIAIIGYFLPTDECCHFAYVEHITTRHKLPTVRDYMSNTIFSMEEHIYPEPSTRDPAKRGLAGYIYQAMHPPLYYLLASAVCAVTPGNWVHKFYSLRVLGLLTLLATVFVIGKSHRELVSRQVISEDNFLFFSILCVFALTPGILLRMITISNLHLALLLCGLFYHQVMRLEGSSEEMTVSRVALLGVLTGCIIATHFFNVILVIVGAAFLLLRRAYRLLPVYLGCAAIVVLPWLLFNYLQYGSLTGWKIVYPMMLDAVNPTKTRYDFSRILQQLHPRFFHGFWNPEETHQTLFLSDMSGKYLSGLVCVAVLGCFVHQLRKLIARDFSQRLDLLCLLGVGLNFCLLVYMSWTESVPCVLGRYMYFSLWPLVFLLYRFLVARPVFERRLFACSLIVSTVMLWTNSFTQVMSNRL